jgi:DnaK suppressor protein
MRDIPNYKPKKNEDFMSEGQIEHFKEKLNAWMKQLILLFWLERYR